MKKMAVLTMIVLLAPLVFGQSGFLPRIQIAEFRDANDAEMDLFYATYMEPRVAAQIAKLPMDPNALYAIFKPQIDKAIASAILASEQRDWQRMTAADAQAAYNLEALMLSKMIAAIQTRLDELQ